jgi:hypothetical protein
VQMSSLSGRRGPPRHAAATLAAAGAILLLATGCSNGGGPEGRDGGTTTEWVPGVSDGTAVCDQIAATPIPTGDHPERSS